MNSIWHKVETSSRIGSGGAELQARQPYCEVDRLEIPRMGFPGKVVIVGEKRVATAGSRSPPVRHGSFSCPMKRVKQCKNKTLSQLIDFSGKEGHCYEDH